MAEITAALVKTLRDKTGAGMLDCKRALSETAGDIEQAVDWLRKKGLAAAAKKSGRAAAEGLIGVVSRDGYGAMVELNSETDFVARNEQFQRFVASLAGLAIGGKDDVERLKRAAHPDGGTVEERLAGLIATIGENMTLRRVASLDVAPGVVSGYVHNAAAPGLGKIGVLIALESTGDKEKLSQFGKQIAMHIAAANPLALTPEDIDPAAIAREKAILIEQARTSGRPPAAIEKMVEGRLRKFYEDVALLEQVFVVDGETKVKAVVENKAKEIGAPIRLVAFRRFGLGEGVEKKHSDFAAEVAAQLQR